MFIYMSGFASASALTSRPKTVYYVYGRYNPPHTGHIYMMLETLKHAKAEGSMVLFLLGNGPIGQRAQNPLETELKQAIIIEHLATDGYEEGIHYKLIEVEGGRPVGSILHYLIGHDMEVGIDTKSKEDVATGYVGPDFEGRYTLIHAAGDKGPKPGETPDKNDLEKLRFISNSLSRYNLEIGPPLVIPAEVAEGVPMSATIVRHDAIHLKYDEFAEKYGDFYDDYTENVYDAIRKAATKTPSTKTKTQKVAKKPQAASAKFKANTKNKGGTNKRKTKKR